MDNDYDLEKHYVHDVYDNPDYNRLFKQKPWLNVKQFINDLEPLSLVADIGCGNGKYLNINENILTFGIDRSQNLLNVAASSLNKQQKSTHQLILSDNINLPFKDGIFDAVISIGVLHHFSTENRRIKALNELVRILRPNGKLMLSVWAMEQNTRIFTSQDVLVPLQVNDKQIEILTKKYLNDIKLPDDFKIRKFPLSSCQNTFKQVSNEKRYYHVFCENELDNLIKDNFNSLYIYKSYYDNGNWFINAIKSNV